MVATLSYHSIDAFFHSETPARLHRGRHDAEAHDGLKTRACHAERSAAKERHIAVIECIAIEIADANTGRGGAHKAIERLIEEHLRGNIHLMRQVAADGAFARRQGSYCSPMPESSSSRVLFSVHDPIMTRWAGWKHSSPSASIYCTPRARFAALSKTMRFTAQLFRSETLFCFSTIGSRVLVGWDFRQSCSRSGRRIRNRRSQAARCHRDSYKLG